MLLALGLWTPGFFKFKELELQQLWFEHQELQWCINQCLLKNKSKIWNVHLVFWAFQGFSIRHEVCYSLDCSEVKSIFSSMLLSQHSQVKSTGELTIVSLKKRFEQHAIKILQNLNSHSLNINRKQRKHRGAASECHHPVQWFQDGLAEKMHSI